MSHVEGSHWDIPSALNITSTERLANHTLIRTNVVYRSDVPGALERARVSLLVALIYSTGRHVDVLQRHGADNNAGG